MSYGNGTTEFQGLDQAMLDPPRGIKRSCSEDLIDVSDVQPQPTKRVCNHGAPQPTRSPRNNNDWPSSLHINHDTSNVVTLAFALGAAFSGGNAEGAVVPDATARAFARVSAGCKAGAFGNNSSSSVAVIAKIIDNAAEESKNAAAARVFPTSTPTTFEPGQVHPERRIDVLHGRPVNFEEEVVKFQTLINIQLPPVPPNGMIYEEEEDKWEDLAADVYDHGTAYIESAIRDATLKTRPWPADNLQVPYETKRNTVDALLQILETVYSGRSELATIYRKHCFLLGWDRFLLRELYKLDDGERRRLAREGPEFRLRNRKEWSLRTLLHSDDPRLRPFDDRFDAGSDLWRQYRAAYNTTLLVTRDSDGLSMGEVNRLSFSEGIPCPWWLDKLKKVADLVGPYGHLGLLDQAVEFVEHGTVHAEVLRLLF